MKHLFLAAALIAATFTSAYAGEIPTRTENEAAMTAGRKLFASKTAELEKDLAAHNMQAAALVVQDVDVLMRKAIWQTSNISTYTTGQVRDNNNKHVMSMEAAWTTYHGLAADLATNGAKVLETAKQYQQTY